MIYVFLSKYSARSMQLLEPEKLGSKEDLYEHIDIEPILNILELNKTKNVHQNTY